MKKACVLPRGHGTWSYFSCSIWEKIPKRVTSILIVNLFVEILLFKRNHWDSCQNLWWGCFGRSQHQMINKVQRYWNNTQMIALISQLYLTLKEQNSRSNIEMSFCPIKKNPCNIWRTIITRRYYYSCPKLKLCWIRCLRWLFSLVIS